jgi:hypothetical protein
VEHAGPAWQLQRQPLQIGAGARFVDAEAQQFARHRLQRVVRQCLDFTPRAGKLVEFPGPVATGTRSPGRVETLRLRRVFPGGEALIEMRGEMTDQRRLQRLAKILASQVAEQARHRPFSAQTVEQLAPEGDGRFRCRVDAAGDPAGHRRPRAQCACRRPQVRDGRTLIVTVSGRRAQQALPRALLQVGLQSFESALLLPLPAQARGGNGRRRSQQRCPQDIAAPQRDWRADTEQFVDPCLRCLPQGGIEIAGIHSPLPEQLAAAIFVEPWTRAAQTRSLLQGVGKRQMLEGMQGVVMNKIAQRRLRRQQMRKVLQAGLHVPHCGHRRGGRGGSLRRPRRTHSDSKMLCQPAHRRRHQAQQGGWIKTDADNAGDQQPGRGALRALQVGEVRHPRRRRAERTLGAGRQAADGA